MEAGHGERTVGESYTVFIEGEEYQVDKAELTGGEIMDLADMIHAQGLVYFEEDGTEVEVVEDDVIDISIGSRFKEPPRFVGGHHVNLDTELPKE